MAGLLYYVVFVVFVVAEGAITHISDLHCTDPDTGKLYEVNSTWPSQTFCGNYTCKLTKANVTETEYTPVPKTNITHEVNGEKEKDNVDKKVLVLKSDSRQTSDMEISPSEVIETVKKVSTDIKANVSKENSKNKNVSKDATKNRDRYLTEAEINIITEILHTVKKSDLEAIIEVYNLAEEIYNEMERSSKSNKLKSNLDKPYVNKISCDGTNDMKTEGSMNSVSRYYAYPADYFRRGLTANDYYRHAYPTPNFQRTYPYVYTAPPQRNSIQKPCNNLNSNSYATPAIPARANDDKPMTTTSPYSTMNIRQNIEDYARYYYNYYPWAQLEVYNRNRFPYYINPYYQQIVNDKPSKSVKTQPSEKSKIPKEVKPKISKVIEKEVPVIKTEEKKESMPKWKTEQLSQQVIDEVKANVLDKNKLLNIFPRRSIQLERVGKVIKLDELSRSKREDEMKEHDMNFGVRLEKIECETSTESGYFSVGNLTAPYPGCCPQKITLDHYYVCLYLLPTSYPPLFVPYAGFPLTRSGRRGA